jgi:hypothetical protein
MTEPFVTVNEIASEVPTTVSAVGTAEWHKSGNERVIKKVRMEHFNPKEKESLQEICFDYMDVFFLPEDRLSCMNAVKYFINLEPGSNTINTSDTSKSSVVSLGWLLLLADIFQILLPLKLDLNLVLWMRRGRHNITHA